MFDNSESRLVQLPVESGVLGFIPVNSDLDPSFMASFLHQIFVLEGDYFFSSERSPSVGNRVCRMRLSRSSDDGGLKLSFKQREEYIFGDPNYACRFNDGWGVTLLGIKELLNETKDGSLLLSGAFYCLAGYGDGIFDIEFSLNEDGILESLESVFIYECEEIQRELEELCQ